MSKIKCRSRLLPKYRRSFSGFTLIEALVTLLVLSIGLLGVASLTLGALQASHSAYFRSLSPALALEFEERLWIEAGETLSSPGQCLTEERIEEIAEATADQWRTDLGLPNLSMPVQSQVQRGFTRNQPSADPAVAVAGTWSDQWVEVTFTVSWTERRFAAGDLPDDTERFDYVLRAPCVSNFIPPPP